MFKDKFNLTVEENVFVAKRNIVDYIWKSANLEGIAVTYPDTYSILNGLSEKGMKVRDIIAINNLKRAWYFILDYIDYELDLNFLCAINKHVGGDDLINRAGYLRQTPVKIGGTKWMPSMPQEDRIRGDLERIKDLAPVTLVALEMMLYTMRSQMFIDGNKRTAMLAANHIMIRGGAGIISIPTELQSEFNKLLVKFYESGDSTVIKMFVYEHCIDGIDFREQDRLSPEDDKIAAFLKQLEENKSQS